MARKIKKHVRRKDLLKEEDEFISITEKAINWGVANWPLVIIAVGIAAAVSVVGLMLKSSAANARQEFAISFQEAMDTVNAPVEGQGMPPMSKASVVYNDETQKYEAVAFKMDKLLAENPKSVLAPFLRLYLADSDIELKKYDDAVEEYNRITQSEPGSDLAVLARHNEGMAFMIQGKYDLAYPIFKELAESDSPLAKASTLVYAGRAAENLGKPDEAISFYQRALDSYSDSVLTNGLKERIEKLRIGSSTPAPKPEDNGPIQP